MEQNNNQKNQTLPLHKIEQFIANVRVLEELAKSTPSADKLKQYKGFGGLGRCFWDKQLYGQVMRAIRANFGANKEKQVLENLRLSSSSAYYTPKEVIKFIYRYLEQVCGFTGGNILEPSCGNGAFFEHMPENIKANSQITGIEYDIITSKLVNGIYPEVKIINDGLQNIDFKAEKFDLIIGNPPYSAEKMTDEFMPDLNGCTIHHYFIAKCMRLLSDNGILAFVMPSFYMDIPRSNTRHIIDGESVIIDVIRLPENLFEQATVTVDIVLLRKTGNKIHDIVKTTTLTQGEASEQINEFWIKNPHRVIGELKLKWVKAYNRFVPTCETQNKAKTFYYLENCQFDNSTLENYQSIVKNEVLANDEIFTDINLIQVLHDNFIAIEQLESEANNMKMKLSKLHNDTWEIIEKLQKRIGEI